MPKKKQLQLIAWRNRKGSRHDLKAYEKDGTITQHLDGCPPQAYRIPVYQRLNGRRGK